MRTPSPVVSTQWQIVDPTSVMNWDELLSHRENATFFHSAAWAAVLKETYGHQPLYLLHDKPDCPPSLLPLMEISSSITGTRAVSLPFSDACMAITDSREGADDLLQKACDLGRERQWRYIELRGGCQRFSGAKSFVSFYTHLVRLCGESDWVFQNCHSSVRRAIRKAKQVGIRAEIATSLDAMKVFYDLHCLTRRKHGMPPQPFAFFASIHRQVIATGQGFIALSKLGSRAIAAGIFFCFADKAIYKFGASIPAAQHLRGNNLMMWSAILRCIGAGCQSLDLGRTSFQNPGLRRYKLGWGAEESICDYLRFDLKTDQFVKGKDRASGWHNHFFRFLPVSIARGIGHAMYPHLA